MIPKDSSMAKILLVDDDRRLLNLLEDTLASIGYSTTSVQSGKEALDYLSVTTPDLVISDISMPEMDGLELLQRIRSSYPKLPVIFITGTAKPDVVGRANPEGFLAKPFRISNLEDVITRTLTVKDKHLETKERRVLVIDDDENFRDMLIEALQVCDYSAIPASSPKEALAILQNSAFDAVVTDIKMPIMDGVSLARTIKDKFPDLPVILITAYHIFDKYNYEDQRKIADGVLQKPFGLELILGMLEKLLRTPGNAGAKS
jgi:CheY-like chemotaxis protein